MEGPYLMAAWASSDGKSVLSSFRQAANEDDNLPEVTGTFAARPTARATTVNSSFLTYTFLCDARISAEFGLAPDDTTVTVRGFQVQPAPAKIQQPQFDMFVADAGRPGLPATGAVLFGARGGDGEDGGNDDDSDD
ncbi:putative Cellobiose dehydrogenase cytochrome domain-containing protein [Seiridium cardinale]